jgi:hypothetical protein
MGSCHVTVTSKGSSLAFSGLLKARNPFLHTFTIMSDGLSLLAPGWRTLFGPRSVSSSDIMLLFLQTDPIPSRSASTSLSIVRNYQCSYASTNFASFPVLPPSSFCRLGLYRRCVNLFHRTRHLGLGGVRCLLRARFGCHGVGRNSASSQARSQIR